MNNPEYEVVWPRGKSTMQSRRLAKRLDTLNDKTVGELWEWVFRGDEIFPVVERELAKRYSGIKFVNYEKFGNTMGKDNKQVLAALPEKLKEYKVDAVISGVGC